MTDEEVEQRIVKIFRANLAEWRQRGLGEPDFDWERINRVDEALWYFLRPKKVLAEL